jgi:hypothetical protein
MSRLVTIVLTFVNSNVITLLGEVYQHSPVATMQQRPTAQDDKSLSLRNSGN